MRIIRPEEFPYGWLSDLQQLPGRAGRRKKGKKYHFKDIVTAFDIETSRLDDIDESIMYLWQWQFGKEFCVMGRTWEEFTRMCEGIKKHLAEDERLCVYVHNLSYEFQFLRGIYPFKEDEVFAVESRKVLRCGMYDALEFRCSYLHSNMSLDMYLKQMGVEHKKEEGFDYEKLRFPWTPLSMEEITYGLHDVLGLVEAITKEMEKDGDDLYTIPLTSTGYIRRECKAAMTRLRYGYIHSILPDMHIYHLCRQAFRGGNTHANRYYAAKTLKNVKSADRSSSYPEVLCNRPFPVGRFYAHGACSLDYLMDVIVKRGKACLIELLFKNIRLKDEFWGAPYIPFDKCKVIVDASKDNGRVLSADMLVMTVTDIDFKIISDEYEWDGIKVMDLAYTRYGQLPEPFKDVIRHHYTLKTELKGTGDTYYYTKSKNKLNSTYGMCAQNPGKDSIVFKDGDFAPGTKSRKEILEENNKHAFLPYQWGVWCTAWARWELERGIKLAGYNFVYCDTDSVKYVDECDFTAYNAEKVKASTENNAMATDSKGKVHYMGVYEDEGVYPTFKTLGAKKYVNTDGSGKLHCTIAGVAKKEGGEELERAGGIEAFSEGFVFHDAGGMELIYNDHLDGDIIVHKEGRDLVVTSNVCLKPSTYKLGITAEYASIIELAKRKGENETWLILQ